MAIDPAPTYESDDWFGLVKYYQTAGVDYDFSKKKMENNVQQSVKNVKSSTEIKSAASQIELFNADRVFRSN